MMTNHYDRVRALLARMNATDCAQALGLEGYQGHDSDKHIDRNPKPVWRDPIDANPPARQQVPVVGRPRASIVHGIKIA